VTTLKVRLRFERRQAQILSLVPAVLGLFCAVQGLILVERQDPLMQVLAVALFLWVPACAYFSWKTRKAWARVEAAQAPSPVHDQHVDLSA